MLGHFERLGFGIWLFVERPGMPREPAFDFEQPKLEPAHPLRARFFVRSTLALAR